MPENPTQPNPIYLIYMYKEDLALNNLKWLICRKTKINQSGSKKLNNQAKSGWPKIMGSEVMLHIQQKALSEYQTSLTYHSPVWVIIFKNSAKVSSVAKLCLMFLKYCNSP